LPSNADQSQAKPKHIFGNEGCKLSQINDLRDS
jgi:hypothetical protein